MTVEPWKTKPSVAFFMDVDFKDQRAVYRENVHRLQRYRQRHPRIDYYPSPDVMPIIKHHLKIGTDPCLAGVIDYLIRTGQRAISGNGST